MSRTLLLGLSLGSYGILAGPPADLSAELGGTSVLAPNQAVSAVGPSCGGGSGGVTPPRIEDAWLNDGPSLHGMVLLGRGPRYYLSHLPMFHRPHDYQAIFEVEVTGAGAAALATRPADALLTMAPETFVLPRMAKDCGTFSGTAFDGHFERGGTAIPGNLRFRIVRTVFFKKFTPGATPPARPRYIAFGDANAQYLAHEITSPPDHDQLVRLSGTNPAITSALSGRAYVPLEGTATGHTALTTGGSLNARVMTDPPSAALDAGRAAGVIYTEYGDLEQ